MLVSSAFEAHVASPNTSLIPIVNIELKERDEELQLNSLMEILEKRIILLWLGNCQRIELKLKKYYTYYHQRKI